MAKEKIILVAPEGVTSASVGGISYEKNKKGVFLVDIAHVAFLFDHGFKIQNKEEVGDSDKELDIDNKENEPNKNEKT